MALPAAFLVRTLATRAAARAVFGQTVTGQLVQQTAALSRGAGSLQKLQMLAGQLQQMAGKALTEGGGAPGQIVMRYANPQAIERTALETVWDALGPVGNVLRSIMGGGGRGPQAPGGVDDELRAAAALLRAHGIENVGEVLGPRAENVQERRAIGTGTRLGGGEIGPRQMSVTQRQALQVARLMTQTGADPEGIASAILGMGLSNQQAVRVLIEAGMNPAAAQEAVGRGGPAAQRTQQAITEVKKVIGIQRVDSSNVYGVGYDEEAQTMFVTYKAPGGGRGPSYSYANVPPNVFQQIRDAPPRSQESVGVKVWELLRQPGRRVEPAGPAAQARGRRWLRAEGGTIWGHKFPYEIASTGPTGYVPRQALGLGFRPRQVQRGDGTILRSRLPGTGEWGGQTAQQAGRVIQPLGGLTARRGVAVLRGTPAIRVGG